MPVDEDLNRLARFLLAYPSAPHTLGELASSLSLSPRTLQRRFQGATGMTFSAWLTLARVCASLDLLATDLSVEHIAHRVGFADPSAFSRAFRRIMDQSPREARHRLRQSDRDRADDARTPTFPTLPVSREGGEQSRTAPVPRLLPTQTWPRVNGSHVAIWVYRGTVDVTVDARHKVLHRGEALILPASTHHEVRAREDSLVLPLGYRPTGRLPATTKHLQVHRFRPETKAALLHGIVSTYTALRPRVPVANSLFDHVALHTIDTGDGASAHLPDTSSSITALLSCLARNPHAPFPAAYWADRLGMSGREFHRSVRIATGVPYPTWRRVSRMTFAREALLRGVPATTVAQQTGYSQLSSFSRAVSATFGAPPRHLASLSGADRNSLPEGPRLSALGERSNSALLVTADVESTEETAEAGSTRASSSARLGQELRPCSKPAANPRSKASWTSCSRLRRSSAQPKGSNPRRPGPNPGPKLGPNPRRPRPPERRPSRSPRPPWGP